MVDRSVGSIACRFRLIADQIACDSRNHGIIGKDTCADIDRAAMVGTDQGGPIGACIHRAMEDTDPIKIGGGAAAVYSAEEEAGAGGCFGYSGISDINIGEIEGNLPQSAIDSAYQGTGMKLVIYIEIAICYRAFGDINGCGR